MISIRLPSSVACLSLALMSLQACGQASVQDCCNVVSVDAARGIVTAEVAATGRRFAFEIENDTLLDALRPGVRFDARGAPGDTRFSLMNLQNVQPDWADNCCNLVGDAARPTVDLAGAANQGDNCCNVVSIDQGIVTARAIATGETFRFRPNAAVLAALAPGASFDTRSIPGQSAFSIVGLANLALDAGDACCPLVDGPAARPADASAGPSSAAGGATSLAPQNAALPAQAGLDSRPPSIDPENATRPAQPLADGVTFELLELRRVAANLVHMGFAIDNRTSEAVDARRWGIFNWVGSGPTKQANGIRVQDMASGEVYRAGSASQGMLDVEPSSRREYWAQYEVPSGVTSIAVLFADAPPLYDIAIDPRNGTSR